MLDEIKELFRAHIDLIFFGDNEIQCVSESSVHFSDPTHTELLVSVIDKDGNKRVWQIVEVKES